MSETKKINRIHVAVLALLVIVASCPLYNDYVIRGTNTLDSLTRISMIAENLGKVFPLRIGPVPNMSHGYGAVSFQADIFLLIPAFLNLIGFGVQSAYKIMIFLINGATAYLAYYSFSESFQDKNIGLAGSVLFVCCPIRCYDLYVHGILGESVAWIFIPLIIYGSLRLVEQKKAFGILVTGFSAILMASVTVFFVTAFMFLLILLAHYKEVFRKDRLLLCIKIAIAVCGICAWYLIPMLSRMLDPVVVSGMLVQNVRYHGKYMAEYLLFEKGAGIAVVYLLVAFLYHWFMGEYAKDNVLFIRTKRLVAVGFILVLLSGRFFPWDIIENKSMVGSMILAILEVPERWSVAACSCLVFGVCGVLALYKNKYDDICLKRICIGVMAVSVIFLTYQMGNIPDTYAAMYVNDEVLQTIPLQVVSGESVVWRLAECISVASAVVLAAGSVLRRRKGVK